MDNGPYLVIILCSGWIALMLKYSRGNIVKGIRRIRQCLPF